MDTAQHPLDPAPTPQITALVLLDPAPTPAADMPLEPAPTPSGDMPLEPAPTPSPDDTWAALGGVALGAVGLVQAVASARSAAPMANAAARRERTSMYTSEAFMQLSRNWCTYTRLLHLSRQSRFGTNDGSFGRQDPCW
jgi:hypothetical protein